jgi:TPR repeat protein
VPAALDAADHRGGDMNVRGAVAVGLILCHASFALAQDAAALDALYREAVTREYGAAGKPSDPAGAAALYTQAARQGHAPSMVRLGYLRQAGRGVAADLPGALAMYDEAARAGNREGQYMEALCHAVGVGTAKDPVKARQLMLAPADAGHQDAQYALGIMLALGDGGPRRDAAARRWLDRAASGPDRELAATAARQRDRIDKSLFAQDTSGRDTMLGLLAFIVVAGAVSGGNGGGGGTPWTPAPSTLPWPSTPSANTPRQAPTMASPMTGDITRILHGDAAIGRPVWRH